MNSVKVSEMGSSKPVIDRIIEYGLIAAVFFLALVPEVSTAALVISTAIWFIKLGLCGGRCFKRTTFDGAVLAFIIIAGLSIAVSPDKAFSSYNFSVLMFQYAAIYYVTVQNITTLQQLKRLLSALLLSAVLAIGYGYYQFFNGIDVSKMLWVDGEQFPELKTRVFSTMQNPNIFAGYLLTIISITAGMAGRLRTGFDRLVLYAIMLGAAVCLSMTYCRGAWLTLALVSGAYTLRFNRRLFIVLSAVAAVVIFCEPSIQQRLLSSFTAGDTSSEMRLGLWESTLAMIIDHPLLGIGWGAYWLVYPEYDFYINNPAVVIVHAHNMYLNFMAETGLLGFGAFMLCMLGHLQLALASLRLRASKLLNGAVLGIALSIICIMINGFTDYVLFNIELSKLYWFLNAVVVIICRQGLK